MSNRYGFNGVNGVTGAYLQSPLDDDELAKLAADDSLDDDDENAFGR